LTLAAPAAAQSATQPARLIRAQLGPAPWNVQSGGIAAGDVRLDARGAVVGLDAARQRVFRPAARAGRPVASRAFLVFSFVGATP
jgi:hypothetical protein